MPVTYPEEVLTSALPPHLTGKYSMVNRLETSSLVLTDRLNPHCSGDTRAKSQDRRRLSTCGTVFKGTDVIPSLSMAAWYVILPYFFFFLP
jgi:hypothetical protein